MIVIYSLLLILAGLKGSQPRGLEGFPRVLIEVDVAVFGQNSAILSDRLDWPVRLNRM